MALGYFLELVKWEVREDGGVKRGKGRGTRSLEIQMDPFGVYCEGGGGGRGVRGQVDQGGGFSFLISIRLRFF